MSLAIKLARIYQSRCFPTVTRIQHSFLLMRVAESRSVIYNYSRTLAASDDTLFPAHYKVALPALSPTMETGSIISWDKKVGDEVKEGDLLAEIETDKATMGFESSEDGFMAKILVEAGAKDIPVGRLLCILAENESDVTKFDGYVAAETTQSITADTPVAPSPETLATPQSVQPATASTAASPPTSSSRGPRAPVMATPRARRAASEHAVDLSAVFPGSDGIVRAQHVLSSTSAAASQPSAAPAHTALPADTAAQSRAEHLTHCTQTIPHYYLSVEVCLRQADSLLDSVRQARAGQAGGGDPQLLDLLVKCAAMACTHVRACNSAWEHTHIREYADVNVAVIAPAPGDGMCAAADSPSEAIIEQAQTLTVGEIGARRCEAQTTQTLSTFSVVSLLHSGVVSHSPIIRAPHSASLGLGSCTLRPAAEGETVARYLMATLSCDHRVIDGAVGAQWLTKFKQFVENPISIII